MNLNKENRKIIRGLIVFTMVVFIVGINYRTVLDLAGTIFGILFPFVRSEERRVGKECP